MSTKLLRICPSCARPVEGEPYDVGSGPEFCCYYCEWCWGANGQALNPDDPFRLPQATIDELPVWARPTFHT